MTSIRLFLLAALALLLLPASPAPAGEPGTAVLCDFETGEPTDTWAFAGVGVADISIEAGKTPSGGRGIKMIGKGGEGRIHQASSVEDWRSYRALSLHAKVVGADKVEMRIRAETGRGRAAMLRRFALEPGPWREVVLPLADWREDLIDQIGSFEHVERIVVQWDQGAGEVSLDDLRLLPGRKGPASSRPTRREMLDLAFPAGDERAYQNDDFLLATNAPELDADKAKLLLARCTETKSLLTSRYRVPDRAMERIPFFVFETQSEYRRFVQRLGKHYGMNVSPGKNSSSLLGICASFYHPKYGWDRPTFAYLAACGVLRRLVGIGTTGNWVVVGLASAAQVRLHPSAMADDFVQKHMRGYVDGPRTLFHPLAEVLDPETSPGRRRGQLVSVMEFLAEMEPEGLARFWERLQALETPVAEAARDALLAALETDVETLEQDWIDWGYEWMPER